MGNKKFADSKKFKNETKQRPPLPFLHVKRFFFFFNLSLRSRVIFLKILFYFIFNFGMPKENCVLYGIFFVIYFNFLALSLEDDKILALDYNFVMDCLLSQARGLSIFVIYSFKWLYNLSRNEIPCLLKLKTCDNHFIYRLGCLAIIGSQA